MPKIRIRFSSLPMGRVTRIFRLHPSVKTLEFAIMIQCQICNKSLRSISASHLRSHGVCMSEYREKFPNAPLKCRELIAQNREQLLSVTSTPEWKKNHSERMSGSRNPFHGRKHSETTRRVMSREQRRLRREGRVTTPENFRTYLQKKENTNSSKTPFEEGGRKKIDRQKALRRYGHACVICGWSEIVHNHHILGVKVSRKIEHMIILCPNHHALADLERITPNELLKLAASYERREV